jgi:hypothetical protein
MKRKFSKIVCIYTDDKNYVPARFNCPDLTIDDVVLNLTTNAEDNFNKIAELIVDYAFALFCSRANLVEFPMHPSQFKRSNWRLLDFADSTKELSVPAPQQIVTSAGPSQVEAPEEPQKTTKNGSKSSK